jgi:hypothetical protein
MRTQIPAEPDWQEAELSKEEAFQKVLASVTGQLEGSSPEPAKKKRAK